MNDDEIEQIRKHNDEISMLLGSAIAEARNYDSPSQGFVTGESKCEP